MRHLKLSAADQKLYSIIALAAFAALLLGIASALIGIGSAQNDKLDNWQSTVLATAPDTMAEFTAVNRQTRWFSEVLPNTVAEAAESAKKALIGEPESFKLIGVVERSGRSYALFLPLDTSPATPNKTVMALAVGEILVNEWKIKAITSGKIIVIREQEGAEAQTRDILLYQPKKP